MRQLALAFALVLIMSTVFVATAVADSHLPATTTEPVVTTVPQTGVGTIAASSTGVVVLLLALAALSVVASIRLRSRPYSSW